MHRDNPDISIARRPERQRYELEVEGTLAAFADYRPDSGHVTFVHTEVLPQHEGKGLGSQLARYALDDTRAQKLKVAAQCEFIARYIERHPQYHDLLVGKTGI